MHVRGRPVSVVSSSQPFGIPGVALRGNIFQDRAKAATASQQVEDALNDMQRVGTKKELQRLLLQLNRRPTVEYCPHSPAHSPFSPPPHLNQAGARVPRCPSVSVLGWSALIGLFAGRRTARPQAAVTRPRLNPRVVGPVLLEDMEVPLGNVQSVYCKRYPGGEKVVPFLWQRFEGH